MWGKQKLDEKLPRFHVNKNNLIFVSCKKI